MALIEHQRDRPAGVARQPLTAGRESRHASQRDGSMRYGMADMGVARDQLRAFIERIERLEEEKKQISDDIKDVYAEAKANGFDVKIMRKVISLRKKEPNEREEEESLLDLYLQALGMTPAPAEA
jgi:uncharacterized protein (UPF0335 family)